MCGGGVYVGWGIGVCFFPRVISVRFEVRAFKYICTQVGIRHTLSIFPIGA